MSQTAGTMGHSASGTRDTADSPLSIRTRDGGASLCSIRALAAKPAVQVAMSIGKLATRFQPGAMGQSKAKNSPSICATSTSPLSMKARKARPPGARSARTSTASSSALVTAKA